MANLGYIQVTRQCNQKCRFCSNPPTGLTVSFDQAREEIDAIAARGYVGIILTGGEPTLSADLPRMLEYCRSKGLPCKVFTNGQRMAQPGYLDTLIHAGLGHVCVSVHSCKPDVVEHLTRTRGSLGNALRSLALLSEKGITSDVLTTITRVNSSHLHETVRFLDERFPKIFHYTWNGLDPRTDRIEENRDLVPKLRDFEGSLFRAMTYLKGRRKPFQVERVPLCYMAEYADCSTETRRIVKGEERASFFLDERGFFLLTDWMKQKSACCRVCRMEPICAGLHEAGTYYSFDELSPVFVDPQPVRERILGELRE